MSRESKTIAIVGLSVDHIEQVMNGLEMDLSEVYSEDWLYEELYQNTDEEVASINYGQDTPATHIGVCIKESWSTIEITQSLIDQANNLALELNLKYKSDKFKLYIGTFTW